VGVSVTQIGHVLAGTSPPRFLDGNRQAVSFVSGSFSHF